MFICYRCGEQYEEVESTSCQECGEVECVFTHQQMADVLNNLYIKGIIEEADIECEDADG